MRVRFRSAVGALVVCGLVAGCGADVAALKLLRAAPVQDHELVVTYQAARDPELKAAEGFLRDRRVLETGAELANDAYLLPRTIPVYGRQCGRADASYDPATKSITVCYELVGEVARRFADGKVDPAKVQEMTAGAVSGFFFHELGHGLLDLYDVPAAGREEDDADQFIALSLINGPDSAEDDAWAMDTVRALDLLATITGKERSVTGRDGSATGRDKAGMSDVHLLTRKRDLKLLCYLYGSNAERFSSLVKGGLLPKDRAVGCRGEYAQMAKAWSRLLQPYERQSPRPAGTD